MKVTVNQGNSRKVVAVLGDIGDGVFLPTEIGGVFYLNSVGKLSSSPGDLESILAQGHGRKPVYEGDTVTLKF